MTPKSFAEELEAWAFEYADSLRSEFITPENWRKSGANKNAVRSLKAGANWALESEVVLGLYKQVKALSKELCVTPPGCKCGLEDALKAYEQARSEHAK
jgi:hypothetical protein